MKHSIAGRSREAGRLLLLVVLAGLCGCGHTAKITGKVTYQGRPVRYGAVTFLSADKTVRSCAIEPDGSYAIEGVPTGEVKIGVTSPNPSRGRSTARRRKPVEAGPEAQQVPKGLPWKGGFRCQPSMNRRGVQNLPSPSVQATSAMTSI